MYKASFVSFEKQNIFLCDILIKMLLVLGVTLVTSMTKKSHIEPKYMKIMIELRNIGKLRL